MPEDWTPLESSNVAAAAYDVDSRKLHVRFRSGGTYVYHDVPEDTHHALLSTSSPGSFVRNELAGFRYSRT